MYEKSLWTFVIVISFGGQPMTPEVSRAKCSSAVAQADNRNTAIRTTVTLFMASPPDV